MNSCVWGKFISLVFSEHWLSAGLVLGIGVTEINVRLPSFWNSQSIEGSRQVNRQLQYYGKEVTKICMGMIGKVCAIIHGEKRGCLKQIIFWICTSEESFFFFLNNWLGPFKMLVGPWQRMKTEECDFPVYYLTLWCRTEGESGHWIVT